MTKDKIGVYYSSISCSLLYIQNELSF